MPRQCATQWIAHAPLRREVSIVIIADHHLDQGLALSDSAVALERGQVISSGPSAALRDDLDLRRKVLWLWPGDARCPRSPSSGRA